MPQYAQSIRKLFHKVDPFEGFDFASTPLDLQGGGGTPILKQVFDASKPKLIVEVGTWKGKSAIWWAEQMRDNNIDGAVVCIDTWLGGLDHITRPRGPAGTSTSISSTATQRSTTSSSPTSATKAFRITSSPFPPAAPSAHDGWNITSCRPI